MANLTITNTFSAGTTAASGQVNTNFSDIKTWLNNRDNGTDFWLNMKVSGSTSNPAEIKSSATDCEMDIDCTGTSGTPRLSWKRSGTTYFTMGVDGADSNKLKVGTTSLTASNAITIVQTTSAVNLRGTATNDSAAAGFYGEYTQSNQSTAQNFPTSGQWGDNISISLTAGDWDISAVVRAIANSATVTQVIMGIGTVTGNSSTGIIDGDNEIDLPIPTQAVRAGGGSIPCWRVSITSTTTYYLKVQAAYSVATPQYTGRISARRIR